eukprot:2308140-Amphidinium_carterae.1
MNSDSSDFGESVSQDTESDFDVYEYNQPEYEVRSQKNYPPCEKKRLRGICFARLPVCFCHVARATLLLDFALLRFMFETNHGKKIGFDIHVEGDFT